MTRRRPDFTVTITADDGETELDCAVYTEPIDRGVGERREYDIVAERPLTPTEHDAALAAARGWRPW